MLHTLGMSVEDLKPVNVKALNTAKKGAQLSVLGELPEAIELELPGVRRKFATQPVVIRGLSMGFNLCGPFMKLCGMDQLHTKNCLSVDGVEVPLKSSWAAVWDSHAKATWPIVLKADCHIEPFSIAHVQLKTLEALPVGALDGLIDGDQRLEARTGLSTWRSTIVSIDSAGECRAGLANLTDRPISVRQGSKYGSLTLLERESDATETSCAQLCVMGEHRPAEVAASQDKVARARPPPPPPPPLLAAAARKYKEEGKEKWTDSSKRLWLESEFRLGDSPWLRTPALVRKAVDLLLAYWDVFSHDGEFGKTGLIKHEIHLSEGPPIKTKYRPLNPVLEKDLDRQIGEWEKHDVIEPSQSQWSFALVAASKKNSDKKRWCVDYRPLNARTMKDTFPIPHIEDNLVRLGKSRVFSGIDGCGAYHVVEVAKKDREKTAFATPKGTYQFKRMPFGLTNAPATYCRLVQMVLAGIPQEMALPYLDDTCVHSPDLDSHFLALGRVLEAHRKAGLKLQPTKCQLFQEEIEYLGHIVSANGVRPPAEYKTIVSEWPVPRTKTQARAWLGKVGYYRRFIKGYAAVARPWTDVTGKSDDPVEEKKALTLTEEMQKSFKELNNCLLTAPVLAYPRFDLPEQFILDTDWSGDSGTIGAVLSQVQDGKERVIAYGAKKLSSSQSNYPPCKGELWAFIFFVRYWRYYLLHRKFLWRTDHEGLKYIRSMEPPAGMIGRWMEVLANYDFEVQYRPGPKHGNADGLSRISHAPPMDQPVPNEAICVLGSETLWSTEELVALQEGDPDMGRVRRAVQEATPLDGFTIKAMSPTGRLYAGLMESLAINEKGLLCRKQRDEIGDGDRLLVCLPAEAIPVALEHAHRIGGHKAVDATINRLKVNTFFPHMRKEVEDWIAACRECVLKQRKGPDQRHTLISQQDGYPWQRLSIDFVGPLRPSHKGNTYILTAKDTFSRWIEAIPVKHANAKTVAEALERDIFCRYGVPDTIHSDRGTPFVSSLMREVAKLYSIRLTTTPAYNPKSNPVERSHRDLGEILRAILETGDQSNWEKALPQALFAMRTTICKATGVSPYRLLFGTDAPQPLDHIYGRPPAAVAGQLNHHEYVQELRRRIDSVHTYAREHMGEVVRRRRKDYHEAKKDLEEGCKVWLYTPRTHLGESRKLSRFWTGPWTILKKLNELMFKIQPDESWAYHRGPEEVSIDRLRPYMLENVIHHPPEEGDDLNMTDDEFAVAPGLAPQGPAPLAGAPPPPGGGGGGGGGGGPAAPPTPPPHPPGPPGSSGSSHTPSTSSSSHGASNDSDYRPPGTPSSSSDSSPPPARRRRRAAAPAAPAAPQTPPPAAAPGTPAAGGTPPPAAGNQQRAGQQQEQQQLLEGGDEAAGGVDFRGTDFRTQEPEAEAPRDDMAPWQPPYQQEPGREEEFRPALSLDQPPPEEVTEQRDAKEEEELRRVDEEEMRRKAMEEEDAADQARRHKRKNAWSKMEDIIQETIEKNRQSTSPAQIPVTTKKPALVKKKPPPPPPPTTAQTRKKPPLPPMAKKKPAPVKRPTITEQTEEREEDYRLPADDIGVKVNETRRARQEEQQARKTEFLAKRKEYALRSKQPAVGQQTVRQEENEGARKKDSWGGDSFGFSAEEETPPRPIMKRVGLTKLTTERERARVMKEEKEAEKEAKRLRRQLGEEQLERRQQRLDDQLFASDRRMTQTGPPGKTPSRYPADNWEEAVGRQARLVGAEVEQASRPKVTDANKGKALIRPQHLGEDSGEDEQQQQ